MLPAAVRILRPGNAATTAAAVLVGALLARDVGDWTPWRVTAAALAAFAFAAAGNVRNDLVDVAIDRAAHPTRPLVTGALSMRAARGLALALYAAAIALGALVGPAALLLVLLALPLMEAYERSLKSRGFAGNVAVAALTGAPFLLGGIAAGHVGPAILALALLAALATAGREVLKDIEDMEADAGARRTLPHRIGARRAALVAAALLVAAIALSPLPWLLETVLGDAYVLAVAAADASFGTAAWIGLRRPDRGQRLAKVGMLLALVALVIGRATLGGLA